jgi:DNA-binding winged helix-turn-helix (wHTH) protein
MERPECCFAPPNRSALVQRAVALLRLLVERAGAPVSKDALVEAGWAGLAVEESNLTVQIAAVRRVLGQEPGGENWIETLPRRGYRYIGPVGPADGESSLAVPEAAPGPSDRPSIAVLPFQSLCHDPEQEYFADGVVEEIITGLARIKRGARYRPQLKLHLQKQGRRY